MFSILEKNYREKELLKILDKIPDLIAFQKFLGRVNYLKQLQRVDEHEQFLYEIYEPTLQIAAISSRPFTGFTKDNYDTLTRLKWRWHYNHFPQKINQEEPQN